MSRDYAPKDIYLGDIAPDYNFQQDADQNRPIHLERDFWRDAEGRYILFRRQRDLGTVSNVPVGKRAQAGFFGHRLGGANKPRALALASGHVDSMKFSHDVLYEVESVLSNQAVDLRRFGDVAPASLVSLHGLSVTIGPILGTRRFDNDPRLEGRPIITNRPLLQSLLTPDIGRQGEEQPAAFMHIPYTERTALRALAHQTRLPNRR